MSYGRLTYRTWQAVPLSALVLLAFVSIGHAQSAEQPAAAQVTPSSETSIPIAADSSPRAIIFSGVSTATSRTIAVVPLGSLESYVDSNKGGAALFGIIGALVETAATADQTNSEQAIIDQYFSQPEKDIRLKFSALLAENLSVCFSETQAYSYVIQPQLLKSDWRRKDKRLDESRYVSIPTTDYILEVKLDFFMMKELLGTTVKVMIDTSLFAKNDLKEKKRFAANDFVYKVIKEFSALDGVSELDAPTGDLVREGAMKISNKICKAKI